MIVREFVNKYVATKQGVKPSTRTGYKNSAELFGKRKADETEYVQGCIGETKSRLTGVIRLALFLLQEERIESKIKV